MDDARSVTDDRRADDRRSGDDRRKRIAEAAYYRSERRGFAPGGEENDWLEAEKEVDRNQDDTKLRP